MTTTAPAASPRRPAHALIADAVATTLDDLDLATVTTANAGPYRSTLDLEHLQVTVTTSPRHAGHYVVDVVAITPDNQPLLRLSFPSPDDPNADLLDEAATDAGVHAAAQALAYLESDASALAYQDRNPRWAEAHAGSVAYWNAARRRLAATDDDPTYTSEDERMEDHIAATFDDDNAAVDRIRKANR